MEQLRIIWLEDGQCILFNSWMKRVSRKLPGVVGKVAERASRGEDLFTVMEAEQVKPELTDQVIRLIEYISGRTEQSVKPVPPDVTSRAFYSTLALCPSSRCSLNCIYCSGAAGDRAETMMEWGLAKAALDFFFHHAAAGPLTLQFHGAGEPMTNPELVKKAVEYAKEIATYQGRRLFTRITTNGVFTLEWAEWLADHFDHISLSLDGPADLHNIQRPLRNGKGSYDLVIRNLGILSQKHAVKRINMVVTAAGVERMEESLRHIRSVCSVKKLRILPMEYCGRCLHSPITALNMEYFEQALTNLMPAATELDFEILTVMEQADYYTDHYCGACGFAICVTPEGNISTCIEATDAADQKLQELFIGRYDEDGGSILIEWEKVFRLRERTWTNLEECRSCVFRTNCAGSCPIRAARQNQTIMSVDRDSCRRVKKILTNYFITLSETLSTETNADSNTSSPAKTIATETNPDSDDLSSAKTMPPETRMDGLSLAEHVSISRQIHSAFQQLEERPWTVETTVIELMKQVGDLSRRFLTHEGYYLADRKLHPAYRSNKDEIGNELADILHSVFLLSDHYGIDLEKAVLKAHQEELGYIGEQTQ